MKGFMLLLFLLVLIWGVAFFRLFLLGWTLLGFLVLFALQYFHFLNVSAWFLGTIFMVLALCLNIPPLRQIFTQKIFHWFRRILPPMSITEKEAIEAGDVWWEKDLFQGKPDWQSLLKIPKPSLTDEEQDFLNNQVETLCAMLDDWEIVHEKNDLPPAVWDYLKKERFFGMIIPKKYGGLEFSPLAHSSVIMKIATRSISAAVTTMVPNSLGPAELLLHYGTDQQKNTYLKRLAMGLDIPCFALTAPEAGSDAGAIPDKGILCKENYEGKEVLGIRLTFDKRYITLAPVATVLGLAFKLYDPSQLLGEKKELGITLCLIPTDHPGVEIGARHFPLNMAFMNGPVRGKEIFIPADWIIGGIQNAGKGWRMLMECLSAGRGISLPALSTATGILASRMTGAYCVLRKQFSVSIGTFEGVEEALTRIAGYTYLLQATRVFVAGALGQGIKPAVATAMAKYHMTELARKVINDAMDIHGGRGIMLGPLNYLARGYQAIPISITVEGANILTRSLMIFGQGAIRCHPFAKEEMKAAEMALQNPKEAKKHFDKQCIKHGGYFISNLVRCWTFSLCRGIVCQPHIQGCTKKYVKKIHWLSSALALSADVALLMLGGDLKRKEKLSARLGDILSQLFMASALVKYYNDEGRSDHDWPIVVWCFEMCLYSAQEAFYGFFQNFPQAWVGWLLQRIIFPFGKAFKLPKDSLGKKVAQTLLAPSKSRAQLTQLCYLGMDDSASPTGLIEATFNQYFSVQTIISKIQQGIHAKVINKKLLFEQQIQEAFHHKMINLEEVKALEAFVVSYKKVISVDEFPSLNKGQI